ncbi:WD40 repeat-like protein [Anaeromyces robustus]|uniref:Cilia- and flagella-associated protein 43 n=1 Tax=Anaeromyces robustus TaxID=1754192 RepID=A0A1Y1XMG5_9FUNG|nr:WD40 repeat-like protein [Anaeromyces robustus]|eukprot:ORX86921.1 WD40 repeat-like protein [Anaeromyces robustus]
MEFYGEFTLADTRGISQNIKPLYVTSTIFCYLSGNCINFVERKKKEQSSYSYYSDDDSSKYFYQDVNHKMSVNHITAITTYPRTSIFSYSEYNTNKINIYNYPSLSIQSTININQNENVRAMAFSSDGKLLAILTDYPKFTVSIWKWKKEKLLCSYEIGKKVDYISFNPLNRNQLCASGNGHIYFMEIIESFKSHSISCVNGEFSTKNVSNFIAEHIITLSKINNMDSNLFLNAISDNTVECNPIRLNLIPDKHKWGINNVVIANSMDGDYLYEYDINTGQCKIVLSAIYLGGVFLNKEYTDNEHFVDLINEELINGYNNDNNILKNHYIEDYIGSHNVKSYIITTKDVIIGGEDGTIKWVDLENLSTITRKEHISDSNIEDIIVSPNYDEILIYTKNKRLYSYDLLENKKTMIIDDYSHNITSLDSYDLDNITVTCSSNGSLYFWNSDNYSLMAKYSVDNTSFTSVKCSPISNILAVGSENGVIRLYDTENVKYSPDNELNVQLIDKYKEFRKNLELSKITEKDKEVNIDEKDENKFEYLKENSINYKELFIIIRNKISNYPIKHMAYEPNGNLLCVGVQEERLYLIDTISRFTILGYLNYSGSIVDIAWGIDLTIVDEDEEDDEEVDEEINNIKTLFVLVVNPDGKSSSIYKYVLDVSLLPTSYSEKITDACTSYNIFKIDDVVTGFSQIPKQYSEGKEVFNLACIDKSIKSYMLPIVTNMEEVQIEIEFNGYINEVKSNHYKSGIKVQAINNNEWLLSYSLDGFVIIHMNMDLKENIKFLATLSLEGGLKKCLMRYDCKKIITIGNDNILRFWEWKLTPNGKKRLSEFEHELQMINNLKIPIGDNIKATINTLKKSNKFQLDYPDNDKEQIYFYSQQEQKSEKDILNQNISEFQENIKNKIEELRLKYISLIEKNDQLRDIEKLEPLEFTIDYDEKNRLNSKLEEEIKEHRRELEKDNLKIQIIKERIKNECWDSMDVVGKTVKSFKENKLTGKKIKVMNYPIRKKSDKEIKTIEKILRIRKIQLKVEPVIDKINADKYKDIEAIVGKSDELNNDSTSNINNNNNNNAKTTTNSNIKVPETNNNATDVKLKSSYEDYLYNAFDLVTNERKRIQIYILEEIISDIKKQFNEKFDEQVKSKNDILSKIEEKNERIQTIIDELKMTEEIFQPILDNDEIPDSCLQLDESEIKAEKYLTEEEKRKLEEKRLIEEQRLKERLEDNWQERALLEMMNGSLDEKNDKDKEMIFVKPECMSKPKEELTEDEIKQIKEYEKKIEAYMEEQEKYKKVLETELRKHQGFITELITNYDDELNKLFNLKLSTDQLIFQNELKIIKLYQGILFWEKIEYQNAALNQHLEDLTREKIKYSSEIPEIKKDLEKCKEDYELTVHKDKEIEKAFRKEFHQYEHCFETLLKIFKKRGKNDFDIFDEKAKTSLNPFKESELKFESDNKKLNNYDVNDEEIPEGFEPELWNKMLEMRSKKIESEKEVQYMLKKFNKMQLLTQNYIKESENYKQRCENGNKRIPEIEEYIFQGIYNLECLFQLKQGQVEYPQSLVVTDYSDAVLINRKIIEQFNEVILNLGHSKIEALKEMKEYRKGISALEWENKVLDFQADDLILKTKHIQLLRVTKHIQDYIKIGGEDKFPAEMQALERRGEYSEKAFLHKVENQKKVIKKINEEIQTKLTENIKLDKKIKALEEAVIERKKINDIEVSHHNYSDQCNDARYQEIIERRRLVDLARLQAKDISILRDEVERLRLKTFPAFPSSVN